MNTFYQAALNIAERKLFRDSEPTKLASPRLGTGGSLSIFFSGIPLFRRFGHAITPTVFRWRKVWIIFTIAKPRKVLSAARSVQMVSASGRQIPPLVSLLHCWRGRNWSWNPMCRGDWQKYLSLCCVSIGSIWSTSGVRTVFFSATAGDAAWIICRVGIRGAKWFVRAEFRSLAMQLPRRGKLATLYLNG